MANEDAIVVKNVRKCYVQDVPVLDNLNMSVQSGSIYGLLGASGCGKTTLLACVVGIRKKIQNGEIRVLGGKPGTKGSGIPGPRVGYMPQEVALTSEFTTEGAIYYFGRINGIDEDVIEERFNFLSNLLQLPPRNRMVKNMSGGQQRRVSFAAALVHNPELLILDEPTVGLDPVLRESIWNHLVNLTRQDGTTVVITTHYIDEARMANKIGLMRNGRLLIEASPSLILERCQCETLEQAFLKLSQHQVEEEEGRRGSDLAIEDTPELETVSTPPSGTPLRNGGSRHYDSTDTIVSDEKKIMRAKEIGESRKHHSLKILKALLIKNLVQFIRHPGGFLFVVIFPLVQVFLFFNAVGGDPRNQQIAVLNEEAHNCSDGDYLGRIIYDEENSTCQFVDLSCRFMHEFQDPDLILKYYPDKESAKQAIRMGKASGIMEFSANFSESFEKRMDFSAQFSDGDLDAGTIDILLDMGDRQIGTFLRKKMYERYFDINSKILEECHVLPRVGSIPLHFEDPIIGERDPKFLMFVVPGFIMTVTYFLACAITVSIIVSDRNEGIWDRSLVAGVKTSEILTAHVLIQYTLIMVQASLVLGGNFVQSGFVCKGSVLAVFALTFLSSACGMLYGFLISVLSENHTTAHYVSSGSYYPVFLLCGCIWPIEGMPKFLQWISYIMPNTLPIISMRALLEKGSSIVDPEVYSGFLVVCVWIIIMTCLSLLGVKYKSH